jgi:adenosylmethionine-8-amino-7-oxononanoate aminotransferase
VDVERATGAALEHGVWVRPFRDLIYVMPPYVTDEDDLGLITSAVAAAVRVETTAGRR